MLDKYDEIEFIYKLNIPLLIKTGDGFRGRCIVCGDSRKNKTKRRLNILINSKHEMITCYCHNCGLSTNLKSFIFEVDKSLYQEYVQREKEEKIKLLRESKLFAKISKQTPKINTFTGTPQYLFKLNEANFVPAYKSKECVEYAKSRKIPQDQFNSMYFCTRPDMACGNMLIFPFRYVDDRLYGFQGRSLKGKKFHTFSTNDSMKVFNLYHVNLQTRVYVLESIIDSFSLPNSIGMLGSDLSKEIQSYLGTNVVYCFDSDVTGRKKALKYANAGKKVFVWPEQIKAKDMNELSCKGISNEMIQLMVDKNTYSGLEAITRLKLQLSKKQ